LIEAEMEEGDPDEVANRGALLRGTVGEVPGERTAEHVTQRDGHRPKLVSTPAGDVEIGNPELRDGSVFRSRSTRADPLCRCASCRDQRPK